MDLSCRWLFDMDSCMTQSLHRCHCFSMTTNVIEIKYLLEFGNPGNVGSGRFIFLGVSSKINGLKVFFISVELATNVVAEKWTAVIGL